MAVHSMMGCDAHDACEQGPCRQPYQAPTDAPVEGAGGEPTDAEIIAIMREPTHFSRAGLARTVARLRHATPTDADARRRCNRGHEQDRLWSACYVCQLQDALDAQPTDADSAPERRSYDTR
jgi:hypothetical protein